jgi:hypothetical protein
MSDMSKKVREARNAKAKRLADEPEGKVDASEYKVPGEMNTAAKTGQGLGGGKGIVHVRAYKRGGPVRTKCEGEEVAHHGGRKARASGGPTEEERIANQREAFGFVPSNGKKTWSPSKPPPREEMVPTGTGKSIPVSKVNKVTKSLLGWRKDGGRIARAMGGPGMMPPQGGPPMTQVAQPPVNRMNFSPVPNRMGAAIGAFGAKRGGKIPAEISGTRPTGGRTAKADGGGNWIAGAVKHPGALHKKLHVPEGEKIPAKKLVKAEHSSNPTERKEADLAKTLKGLHKAGGGGLSERMPRASGGKAGKGKTSITIIVGSPKQQQPPMMPPGGPPMPPAHPPMMAPPPGGPPAMGGPGAPPMPPPSMGGAGGPPQPVPPMRKAGGRVHNPGYPLKDGSGGGEGRKEKIRAYGAD